MGRLIYFTLICFLLHACFIEQENGDAVELSKEILEFPILQSGPNPGDYLIVFPEYQMTFRNDLVGSTRLRINEVNNILSKHRLDTEIVDHVYALAWSDFSGGIKPNRLPDFFTGQKVSYIKQDRKSEPGSLPKLYKTHDEEGPILSTQMLPWSVSRFGNLFPFMVSVLEHGYRFDSFSNLGYTVKHSESLVNIKSKGINNKRLNYSEISKPDHHTTGNRGLGEMVRDGHVLNHSFHDNHYFIAFN
ncbi:hypothetical protein [Cecembia rubra]|uniref:hypothetical protein n=1 Tax=Cecembia rubra TaxID=1485585 RepID=UPI0027154B1E|nr:hypothetical protein [Cecembia rubra]